MKRISNKIINMKIILTILLLGGLTNLTCNKTTAENVKCNKVELLDTTKNI